MKKIIFFLIQYSVDVYLKWDIYKKARRKTLNIFSLYDRCIFTIYEILMTENAITQ